MTPEKRSKIYEQPKATLILLCAHDIMNESFGIGADGGNTETGFGDIALNPL